MVTEPAPVEAADELFDPEVPVFMCFVLLANPICGLSCTCNNATAPEVKCYSRAGPLPAGLWSPCHRPDINST
jgi:hypothetical protein